MKGENKIEKIKNRRKGLNLCEYLIFISMSFLFAGFGLFIYLIFYGYNLNNLMWYNDPILFLGIGFTMLVCCFLQYKYKFFSYLDSQSKDGDLDGGKFWLSLFTS